MKRFEKICLVVLIFLVIFTLEMMIAFKAEGAEIHGNAQFGYVEEVELFEAEINVQFVPWHWMTLYGGISVLVERSEKLSFFSYRDIYIVGTKINITKDLYVDLYRHYIRPAYSHEGQFYDKFASGIRTRFAVGIEW